MWFPTVNKVLRERLLSAIELLRNERNGYADRHDIATTPELIGEELSNAERPRDENKIAILKSIDLGLAKAETCAKHNKFDQGWNYLFIVEQDLVKLMSREQRIIKASSLRIEASKITGWRQKQIYMHLCEPKDGDDCNKVPEVDDIDKIVEALKVRNDFYTTRNHKLALRRVNLSYLTLALIVIIILLISFSSKINIISQGNITCQIIFSILFGALGASFSMAYTLSTTDLSLKIPDQLQGIYNTIIRLSIGGTSAFIVLMLYKSGILGNLFSEKILGSEYMYIVLSFLSGFSERWVMNLLSAVTKEKENQMKNENEAKK